MRRRWTVTGPVLHGRCYPSKRFDKQIGVLHWVFNPPFLSLKE